ncbi:gliotoxin biosynthesis protein GliK [Ceratocystis lukuohia]|uniref:gamma-glutamylcyclotransferase n=1 Tax=Ceratocystis lukuohia TaxID=2019550 RepID=A0ABR4MNT0_9PEZI
MVAIPPISPERLASAQISTNTQGDDTKRGSHTELNTVLYLAYGSNLNSKIITQAKGAHPLGKINVTAPSLRLVFDLSGIPYLEPCFANTALRKLPKDPLPDPINPGPTLPPIQDPKKPVWDKGLIGTVYEITKEDYAKIMAKEGGGSGYVEILVPCIALPPSVSIPERPDPSVPRPFIARTLYLPDIPGHIPDFPTPPDIPNKPPKSPEKPNKGDCPNNSILAKGKQRDAENPAEPDPSNPPLKPDPKRKWWLRLVTPHKRPNPEYAQASSRYLNLIVQGAKENELPTEYQAYLESFQPYTITTFRQKVGRAVMLVTALPTFLILMLVAKYVSDKNGKYPTWLAIASNIMFNIIWIMYDNIMKPLFGDGERTILASPKAEKKVMKEVVRNSDDTSALLGQNGTSDSEEEA